MSKLSIASGVISYLIFLIIFIAGEKYDLLSNELTLQIVVVAALILAAIFTEGLTEYIERVLYGELPRYIKKPVMWRYVWQPALMGLFLFSFLLIVVASYLGVEKFI